MVLITVYSLVGCPYSINAENLVTTNLDKRYYRIVKVDREDKEHYKRKHGYFTFPHVYIDDKLIGGYTELKQWLNK